MIFCLLKGLNQLDHRFRIQIISKISFGDFVHRQRLGPFRLRAAFPDKEMHFSISNKGFVFLTIKFKPNPGILNLFGYSLYSSQLLLLNLQKKVTCSFTSKSNFSIISSFLIGMQVSRNRGGLVCSRLFV